MRRDEKHMSELQDALRTGAQGKGRERHRTKETLSEANVVYHQHGVNSIGYGRRYLFQNVFGDKDAKQHICTEPDAGKDL